MKRYSRWLAAALMMEMALMAHAAPAPAPTPRPEGPLADALRLAAMLPRNSPLRVSPAVMDGEAALTLDMPAYFARKERRTVTQYVVVEEVVIEQVQGPDGKVRGVERKVKKMVPVTREIEVTVMVPGGKVGLRRVKTVECKFFQVSKEGKLESVEAAKAAGMLKKKTAVLTGDSAEVDPRNLELIKAGTLYVVVPLPTMPPADLPPIPDKRP